MAVGINSGVGIGRKGFCFCEVFVILGYDGVGGGAVGLQERGFVTGHQGVRCVAPAASHGAGVVHGRCVGAIRAGCFHARVRYALQLVQLQIKFLVLHNTRFDPTLLLSPAAAATVAHERVLEGRLLLENSRRESFQCTALFSARNLVLMILAALGRIFKEEGIGAHIATSRDRLSDAVFSLARTL